MDREEATLIAKARWGKWGRAWKQQLVGKGHDDPWHFCVGIGATTIGCSTEGFAEALESSPSSSHDERITLQFSPPSADFQYDVAIDRVRAALESARTIAGSQDELVIAHVAGLILAELRNRP